MTNSTPFNININSGSADYMDIDNTELNNYKDYIIHSNQVLTNENNSLRIKVDELHKDNSEKEDEIDKYDEKIRYMRGLLQNLYLLKEKSTSLKNKWEKHTKNYCKTINKYSNINYIFNYNIYTVLLLYITYSIYTKTLNSLVLFMFYQSVSFMLINIQQKIMNKNTIQFFKNKQNYLY